MESSSAEDRPANEKAVDTSACRVSHCHDGKFDEQINLKARRQLVIASVLCLMFMTGEIVGGVLAHSLALMSDGVHLLADFASFMIAIVALYLGRKKPTKRFSFGWYRLEILGALVSILLLWVLTGILCYAAGVRIVSGDYHIDATIMLITSGCGVAFNIILGFVLHQSGHGHSHGGLSHGHSHQHGNSHHHGHEHGHALPKATNEYNRFGEPDSPTSENGVRARYGSCSDESVPKEHGSGEEADNINVKAAFIHVVGDLLQSIGVLIAAIIIYFRPGWKIADPICTFLFSVLVIITTVTILKDIIVVLMEGTPTSVDFSDIRNEFFTVKGVKDIHNLRVWSLTMDKIALSVHIAIDIDADPLSVPKIATCLMRKKFGVTESTMQIEAYTSDMLDCTQCRHLKD